MGPARMEMLEITGTEGHTHLPFKNTYLQIGNWIPNLSLLGIHHAYYRFNFPFNEQADGGLRLRNLPARPARPLISTSVQKTIQLYIYIYVYICIYGDFKY